MLLRKIYGLERAVTYASRSLSIAQDNYSRAEKECFALIWAAAKFCGYQYGWLFNAIRETLRIVLAGKFERSYVVDPTIARI